MHRSCERIADSANMCSFCGLKRLLKEFKTHFRIQTTEYERDEYEEEVAQDVEDKEEEDTIDELDELEEMEKKKDEFEREEQIFQDLVNNNLQTHETKIFENAVIQKFVLNESLPGYDNDDTIEIKIYVPDGIQNVIFN